MANTLAVAQFISFRINELADPWQACRIRICESRVELLTHLDLAGDLLLSLRNFRNINIEHFGTNFAVCLFR